MAAQAQILAKRFLRFALSLCSFVPQCLCGFVSIMQNEPNLQASEMDATADIIYSYGKIHLFCLEKNKANL